MIGYVAEQRISEFVAHISVHRNEHRFGEGSLYEAGEELETYTDFDWSEYSVAKDIVDHRDGRVTVYMAKPNEQEQVAEALKIIYGE